MIGNREGFGNILAEGPNGALEILGRKYEPNAPNVKGDMMAMHDARTYLGKALLFAVCAYGPDHSRGSVHEVFVGSSDLGIKKVDAPTTKDLVNTFVITESFNEVLNSMMSCTFAYASYAGGLSPSFIQKFYHAVTGENASLKEMLDIGLKLVRMKRDFNKKAGLKIESDKLHQRFKDIPRYVDGKPFTIDVTPFVEEYHRIVDRSG
jgi:aldehyde:ferredoxin oxidoreductase